VNPELAASILGVEQGADRSTIETAYRRKARHTHPDRSAAGSSADEFVRAGVARDTLLAERDRPKTRVAAPEPSASTGTPTVRATPIASPRGRGIAVISITVLLVVVALVVVTGVLTDQTETNPGSVKFDSDSLPQDPLSGATILPVKSVPEIEAHCGGRNACWVWSIVAKQSCSGTVVVDFYNHPKDASLAESATQRVVVNANEPSYVSVSSMTFREPYAVISQYDC
jgi:hypothetical protein